MVSAATLQRAISPGEIVSIFGANIGTPPLSAQSNDAGLYPAELGHTTVTFNGTAAALLYVSTNQINAMVPYAVAGQRSAEVVVTHHSRNSPVFTVPVKDTSPGIFMDGQSGNGPGAILNSDIRNPNIVTVNSTANPAVQGSAISIFATGSGLWSRPVQDGSIFLAPIFPAFTPAAPVSVSIGGQAARILYAGAAPYLALGVLQVNAIVPEGIGSGAEPVILTIGQNSNDGQDVTVAVE